MIRHFTFQGRSGTAYGFELFYPGHDWRRWQGLYAFVQLSLFDDIRILYVGETFCLHSRIRQHERWPDAVRRGASHILIRHAPKLDVRLMEERDLIKGLNPSLNRVHRLRLKDVVEPIRHLREEQEPFGFFQF